MPTLAGSLYLIKPGANKQRSNKQTEPLCLRRARRAATFRGSAACRTPPPKLPCLDRAIPPRKFCEKFLSQILWGNPTAAALLLSYRSATVASMVERASVIFERKAIKIDKVWGVVATHPSGQQEHILGFHTEAEG